MSLLINITHIILHTSICRIWREVGLCINKIASNNAIVVPKIDATSRYPNLMLFKSNSQLDNVRIPLLPFMNQKTSS